MRYIFGVWHPAHIHFFKNTIWNLEKKGHEALVVTRPKEFTIQLLNEYGFRYEVVSQHQKDTLGKAMGLIKTDYKLYKIAKKFNPHLLTGITDMYSAHVGKLLGKPSIIFTDTEKVKLGNAVTFPFTKTICTPSCFREKINSKKHIKFEGYKELAYLHPNHFKPTPSVLDELNISKTDKFILLRFISWAASHDVGLRGIKKEEEKEFIKTLEDYGEIVITSERKLSSDLEKYRITCSPDKIHSLLYYAQLYIGEGGTMATEAAVLGTPSIHIEANSEGVATGNFYGNFVELRDKYDLLYFYPDQKQALDKAVSILENKNSKKEWQKKRERLLSEKIDVTAWMTDFIERYPESFHEQMSNKS